MTIIDWVLVASSIALLVIGIAKGFMKQLLSLFNITAVTIGTLLFCHYPNEWLTAIYTSGVSGGTMNETHWLSDPTTRSAIAIIATFLVLMLLMFIIKKLLCKIVDSNKLIKALDRVFGGVISIALVYIVFATLGGIAYIEFPTGDMNITEYLTNTLLGNVIKTVNEWFTTSAVVQKIFPPDNFICAWLSKLLTNAFFPSVSGNASILIGTLAIAL
ncbi:MAG: CvpA family protein [Clostridia bacterium]